MTRDETIRAAIEAIAPHREALLQFTKHGVYDENKSTDRTLASAINHLIRADDLLYFSVDNETEIEPVWFFGATNEAGEVYGG